VSGMNQRQAGEDFYFLQKLAKTGRVDQVFTTTVRPSSRASGRVPFGTGQRVGRYLAGGRDEYLLYDPRCYDVLREWLAAAAGDVACDSDELLARAEGIAPPLRAFLEGASFPRVWGNLQANARDAAQLLAQFHRWFDGFRTVKLIHYLRDNGYPLCEMFSTVGALLDRVGVAAPVSAGPHLRDDLDAQKALLEHLREVARRTGVAPAVGQAKGR